MGDVGALLMIGLRVERDQIFEKKDFPGCEHKHSSKFCPECGSPANISKGVLKKFAIQPDDGEIEVRILDAELKLDPYTVRSVVDDDRKLGFVICMKEPIYGGLAGPIKLLDCDEEFKTFMITMEKHGLWNPDEFGAWAQGVY